MDLGDLLFSSKDPKLAANDILKMYSPETGGRSFEENQGFFIDAKEEKTWRVHKVGNGEFKHLPRAEKQNTDAIESTPLLDNSS